MQKNTSNSTTKLVDKWGDSGKWETLIDFTSSKNRGVTLEQLLVELKKHK